MGEGGGGGGNYHDLIPHYICNLRSIPSKRVEGYAGMTQAKKNAVKHSLIA